MANVKHVGKLKNGDKVVVLFKTVPNEYHQCLVTETKNLPSTYHDRLMELVESDEGQQSADLADLLGRRFFADGSNVLNTLHSKGFIKKVETKHVLLTPNVATSVPLNQINDILNNNGPGKKPVSADDYAQPPVTAEEPVLESTVPVTTSSTTNFNALLLQAEFHEREAARLRSLVAESSHTTTTVNVQEKKRGRPPKTTTMG